MKLKARFLVSSMATFGKVYSARSGAARNFGFMCGSSCMSSELSETVPNGTNARADEPGLLQGSLAGSSSVNSLPKDTPPAPLQGANMYNHANVLSRPVGAEQQPGHSLSQADGTV